MVASTETKYDPLGRAVRSADFLGRPTLAAYEPFCVGHTTLSPRGVQTSSSFDTLCRLVQVETQEERHLFAYDELDRMTGARVGELYAYGSPTQIGVDYSKAFYKHDTFYDYDSLDRVTQITYANGENVSYQYDAESNVTQMTDVHGNVTQYTYYNDGRLHTVVYEGQTFTYSYDAAGRLETIAYPSGGLEASFTTTTGATGWDANGQLLSLRYLKSGVHFHRFEYTYDDSGNRITLVDTPDVGAATSWSYGYDYLNRLTSVTRGSSTTLYAYDESDNRFSLTLPSGDEWTYGFDLADQITSRSFTPSGGSLSVVETYTHDGDGNMDSRTQGGVTTTYDWNTFNRLRQVKVGSAVLETTSYDHGGIRRLKVDGGGSSKSFSSGAMSLADTRPSGPVSFVQGHQLLGLEQGGNLYFMITDGLSSVRKVVNSSGVSQGEFKFDEFGVPESSTTPPADLSAHSYVGGLGQRNEGGLYYARQRWYDPQLGRWLNQDPIGFDGGLNLFGYTGQNPVNFTDPSGLERIYPDSTLYPSQELEDFRKEYRWPTCTQELMENQIEWENNALNSQITVHFLRRNPGMSYLGRLRAPKIKIGTPKLCGVPSNRYNIWGPPKEAYNRVLHFGKTPTSADRKAIGAGPGQVADHRFPLVRMYYEGDPTYMGGKPGHAMTPAERRTFATDRNRMDPMPAKESHAQGAAMSQYSKKMKRMFGL